MGVIARRQPSLGRHVVEPVAKASRSKRLAQMCDEESELAGGQLIELCLQFRQDRVCTSMSPFS